MMASRISCGRRQFDSARLIRHADRSSAPAVRAAARAAGIGMPAPRAVAAFAAGIPRARSRCARARPIAHARDVVASIRRRQRCRRVRLDPEDRHRAHGLRAGALWVPDKNIELSMTRSGQPMSPESLQARATASDGLDAAAAAHDRRQSYLQGRERRGRSLQDSGMPGSPPVRAGDGRAGALQSAERARFRFASNPHRRAAGERKRPSSFRRSTIPAPAS
jgi:hypothetical protein